MRRSDRMGLLAFGLFLLFLGFTAVAVALPTLGWALVSAGAVLSVAHLAVGPRRRSRAFLR